MSIVTAPCGRTWDPAVTVRQIGRRNLLVISGGRARVNAVGNLILPVAYGYEVEVEYEVSDTYAVRRVFTRGIKRFVKGQVSGVYADQVGEVAYRASCFRNVDFGEE